MLVTVVVPAEARKKSGAHPRSTGKPQQNQAEIGFCLLVSGILAVWEANGERTHIPTRAAALFQECLIVFEALGDPFYQANALAWLAWEVPMISGEEHHSGQALLKQSLDLRRKIGDRTGRANSALWGAMAKPTMDPLMGFDIARDELCLYPSYNRPH